MAWSKFVAKVSKLDVLNEIMFQFEFTWFEIFYLPNWYEHPLKGENRNVRLAKEEKMHVQLLRSLEKEERQSQIGELLSSAEHW